MGAELKYIIGLAFAMSLGILLLILSCALYNNWNPMFALIPFLLSPLPSYLFTGQCCQSDDVFSMDDSSAGKDWGYFVTSVFVVSGFGVILVMAHVDIIGNISLIALQV
ncbi:hypothetical protein MP638_002892 [Amoeboaphelidium occidentale]|jgi:hypothetical protein|nr:hypothetical protein MP638_002892 [Amoeboaphelidium occidentale]